LLLPDGRREAQLLGLGGLRLALGARRALLLLGLVLELLVALGADELVADVGGELADGGGAGAGGGAVLIPLQLRRLSLAALPLLHGGATPIAGF
jgi:hypothetical protein